MSDPHESASPEVSDSRRRPPGGVRLVDEPGPRECSESAPDWSGARFLVGDVFERMAELPDGSVDVVVTSTPFLALRSYLPSDHPDKAKEIGQEGTPAGFLDVLLDLTTEWRRILTPHGSICVELGDTYSGAGGYGDPDSSNPAYGAARYQERYTGRTAKRFKKADDGWPEAKSLCLVPSLYAASLAYGRNLLNPAHEVEPWRVRNLIAWTRPNPPVGALSDKVRPATSYVTTACTGRSRYFDNDAERTPSDYHRPNLEGKGSRPGGTPPGQRVNSSDHTVNPAGAPLLDHWSIPTTPFTGSHYAVFPEELPRRLISLMCPVKVCRTCGRPSERITEKLNGIGKGHRRSDAPDRGSRVTSTSAPDCADVVTVGWTDCGHDDWRPGTVLDPFAGSGTTLAVAVGMGRRAIGIDIDERNVRLAEKRVGMFLEVA